MFFEQTQIFQERRAIRKDMFFQEGSIVSVRRTDYYLIKQILIFPETLI